MLKRVVLGFLGLALVGPLYSTARAGYGYFTGTAAFLFLGYPGLTGQSLDPAHRIPWRSTGCVPTGFEILTHVPNNLTLELLGALLGPMRGTYHGPYPTREEAAAALGASHVAIHMTFAPGRDVEPGADCETLSGALPVTDENFPEPARCALFKDDTLILADGRLATLVERKTGTVYARFGVHY